MTARADDLYVLMVLGGVAEVVVVLVSSAFADVPAVHAGVLVGIRQSPVLL
jgi:hypothetical protein